MLSELLALKDLISSNLSFPEYWLLFLILA